jgi:cytochrome c551/c552
MTQGKTIRAAALAALSIFMAGSAFALDIQLPPETAAYRSSNLPGYQAVQRNCMACHSANYVQTQPLSQRAYWEATVVKMKKVFGAQFSEEDIPAMVDYLSKTYGAERSANTAAAPGSATGLAVVGRPADAEALIAANACMTCHAVDHKVVGPAFKGIVAKYKGNSDALVRIGQNIRMGGGGKWGAVPMPPFRNLSDEDVRVLAQFVLSQ